MQSIKKIEDFLLEKKIGEGQFGTVYKSRNIKTNEYFAIKVISKSLFENNKLMRRQLQRETVIMSNARHENLMYLHRSFETNRNYYLVLDHCNGGDLEKFIYENKIKHFSESEAIKIIKQIMKGFQELRKRNVMHRDLKLENIFISGSKIVLGDFGAAKVVKEMTSTTVGTPLNMAPEVMAGEDYNNKSDLWSIGIVFYKLLVGKPPFFALSIGQLKQKALSKSGKNLDFKKKTHFCEQVKNLLRSLLEPNPEKRISWEEFFNHKLFSKDHLQCCKHILKSSNTYLLEKFLIKSPDTISSKNILKEITKAQFINKDKSNNLTAANSPISDESRFQNFHKKVQSRTGINQIFNNSGNSINSPQITSIENSSFNLLTKKTSYQSENHRQNSKFSLSNKYINKIDLINRKMMSKNHFSINDKPTQNNLMKNLKKKSFKFKNFQSPKDFNRETVHTEYFETETDPIYDVKPSIHRQPSTSKRKSAKYHFRTGSLHKNPISRKSLKNKTFGVALTNEKHRKETKNKTTFDFNRIMNKNIKLNSKKDKTSKSTRIGKDRSN